MISVVICTYNGEAFLREQLESILGQSRRPEAILLSDDGSSDGTLALARQILESPAAEGIEITIRTRATALGAAGNFSEALGQIGQGLVALADQDDVWHKDKLAILGSLLEAEPDLLAVHTDAALVDSTGRRFGSLMSTLKLTTAERAALGQGRGLDALLRRNLVTGATMVFRSELLQRALPVPRGWVHDEWLALVAALSGGLRFERQELLSYRQHGGNDIGVRALSATEARERLGQSRTEFFARKTERNEALRSLVASPPTWLGEQGVRALQGKIEHDQWRVGLPDSRLARVPGVLRRWVTGHYARYARGAMDVVRDLVLKP